VLWLTFVDGVPFRKLGDEYNLSAVAVYKKVKFELESLPDNNQLTKEYCQPELFSGVLIMDGKYIKARPYAKKIPFIYAIDYATHDIPVYTLSPAEDIEAFKELFELLKTIDYPLKIVIADDRSSLKIALNLVLPGIPLQLCHVHYLENIRQLLHIRTEGKYQEFFNELKSKVFDPWFKNIDEATAALKSVWLQYFQTDNLTQKVLYDIAVRREDLFAYVKVPNCPKSTNLIELYNSHANSRLNAIKGFKSFKSAKLFLNGLIIRRRTKPLTDCRAKFRHLNGKASLSLTAPEIPPILGVRLIKKAPKS